ncbi:MAG: 50S ribosomal protein L5 [Candidatus Methanomethylicia archaeon]|nr:50S ribosomal protein L5 [Candidatus Methanomethylicia archaeon]
MSEGAKAAESGISNPMREVRIGKVVVNMGLGEGGEKLEKAMTVMKSITGVKPCPRKAKKSIREFGVRKGENIACVATLREEQAEDFLKRAFESTKNRIKSSCFDDYGNVSFGIKEHINLPGTKYDPLLGIFGMNVCIVLERPGYRVARRSQRPGKIGDDQRVGKEESMAFMKDRFGLTIIEEE